MIIHPHIRSSFFHHPFVIPNLYDFLLSFWTSSFIFHRNRKAYRFGFIFVYLCKWLLYSLHIAERPLHWGTNALPNEILSNRRKASIYQCIDIILGKALLKKEKQSDVDECVGEWTLVEKTKTTKASISQDSLGLEIQGTLLGKHIHLLILTLGGAAEN